MRTNSTTRPAALLAILLILIAIWWTWPGPSAASSDSARGFLKSKVTGAPLFPGREKEASASRTPRPALGKKSAGDGPEAVTSVVHTIIPAGYSMVTGGSLKADGSREFIVITPYLVDNGGKQFLISTCLFKLTAAGLESTGLKSLVTNEEKTEQHAEVWTSEEVEALLRNQVGMEMVSRPSIYLKPGTTGMIRSRIMTHPGGGGYNVQPDAAPFDEVNSTRMSIEANEAPNGGIELKLEITSVK